MSRSTLAKLEAAKYRVIRKSLRDFRHLRYRRRYGYAEGERVNKGRDTPSFCRTLQVFDMSTLCHVIYRVLQELDYRIDICSVTKGGHIEHLLGRIESCECLSLCWHAWPSRLLYRRGRKSRRDLWITLYFWQIAMMAWASSWQHLYKTESHFLIRFICFGNSDFNTFRKVAHVYHEGH
jgi:hypothetical protein